MSTRALDDHVTVPYRRNRVMIFDSALFHRTAALDFRPGYENRHINVTMLLSYRHACSTHHTCRSDVD